jgi:hypothetical protein
MARFMICTEIKEEEMNGTFDMLGREENGVQCVDGKTRWFWFGIGTGGGVLGSFEDNYETLSPIK